MEYRNRRRTELELTKELMDLASIVEDQIAMLERLRVKVHTFQDRGFFGRMKWLFLGQ